MNLTQDSFPKYVINFDELTQLFKEKLLRIINNELNNKYPKLNTNNLEAMLEDIKELLPTEQYRRIRIIINDIVYQDIMGIQKVEGRLLDVPPIIRVTKESFQFEKDIYLTGLQFNQTGWKKNDRYTLEINKQKIINNATIKEIGEHKYFNTYFLVNANTPIDFTLDNRSGNSRQTMIDLEYIERTEPLPPPIDPPTPNPTGPGIEDIINAWDVAVVMNWEEYSSGDLDLHGIIGDKHIYFGTKDQLTDQGLYMNFDCRSHMQSTDPEILSVKGHKNSSLAIYVHNYNAVILTHPISIKIYGKDSLGNNNLLREMSVTLENNSDYLIGVCTINLNTLEIIGLDKKIKTLNGGL